MPDRFRRDTSRDQHDQDDQVIIDATLVERNALKLDRVKDDLGDMRVAMTSLAGDVRTLVERQREQATTGTDVERRLRALERRSYAIPGASVVLASIGTAVAVWAALKPGQ